MNAKPNHFWRDLEEWSARDKFRTRVRDEFLPHASQPGRFNRRNFLKLMGTSLALAGLPACTRQPVGKIIPYVNQPENLIPGKPQFFATCMTMGGFATGLLVESHEGHPTKIEGNPAHSASLGATSIFHQAALHDLYDPSRSQAVLNRTQPATWDDFGAALTAAVKSGNGDGRGIRLLTGSVSSPTLHHQIKSLLKAYPGAQWHQFDGARRDNVLNGAKLAFEEMVDTRYQFDHAAVVVSLDSDFLHAHPHSVRHARDFADGRRARSPQAEMNRLYVIESSPSVTGSNADHRLPLTASEITNFAMALAATLDAANVATTEQKPWLTALKADLLANRGRSIVIAGENQPPIVHALAHQMNDRLGNIGKTILYTSSALAQPVDQLQSLGELCDSLERNEVDALIILGGNPVHDAPADFDFAKKISKTRWCAHLGPHFNETAQLCDWHIPESHFLESWSDARAFDGTTSIVQPLIIPLYASKSAHEVLDALISPPGRTDYEIVRAFWNDTNSSGEFEEQWHRTLRDGLILNTVLPAKSVTLQTFQVPAREEKKGGYEITFRPDPNFPDARFAHNDWLHELPRPITKLVWDNPALISPSLAQQEGLSNGDMIELEAAGRRLQMPVWIMPGQPARSIALYMSVGSTPAYSDNGQTGFNPNPLRSSRAFWNTDQVRLAKIGGKYPLVTTQTLHAIDSEERQIIREGEFQEFQTNADFVRKNSEAPTQTLFKPEAFKYDGHRWGMVIDLSACIGCNACILGCQSENNIPVVGKTEVSRGRHMQWIRIDSYFRGSPNNPETSNQPVACMQCENAPCELVCPVGATLHDHEGLNLQVYNRCIGTRYCSNNCPYKVRRFNFFHYADYKTAAWKPMWNPNVTVRGRGVMEKCTYCVQRINAARVNAEENNQKIRDGELQTACQQVCPARAITFGDLNDPDSAVAKLKSHPLSFSMLGELNTRPRTTYLAKLRNPNPALSTS